MFKNKPKGETHSEKMARKKIDRAKRHRYQDDPLRYKGYLQTVEANHQFAKERNARNGIGRPRAIKETEQ